MAEVTYRMIAIDLDGTLLSPRGEVTPRTKQAIHKALKSGLLICFATGRNWTESQMVLDAVEHYSTAVFVGGAMVVDTKKKVTLHRTLMDAGLARELCAFLESKDQAVLALQDAHSARGTDYLVNAGVEMNPATAIWLKVTKATYEKHPTLADHPHEHTIRVGSAADPQTMAELMLGLNEKFAERVYVHNIAIPGFPMEIMEIFDPSVSKWEGIKHVARAHGVKDEEIIAIGDDVNDLAMLKNAGLGVAMGNAKPSALAVAKRMIGSNADDGLAEFLEELVAQHTVEPAP